MSSLEKKVRNTILMMKRPFRLSDLIIRLSKEDITDIDLILKCFDELQDAGLVNYSEVQDNCWAYTSRMVG